MACPELHITQVLAKGGDKYKFEQPNPFVSPEDEEELASCAYRYRSCLGLVGWLVGWVQLVGSVSSYNW